MENKVIPGCCRCVDCLPFFVHFHTQGNLGLGLESWKIRVRTEKLGLEGKLRIRVGRET